MNQQQAARALARATAAGWDKTGNGRVLLGILARRAELIRQEWEA